jgi:two-component system nitrate/nitrite response regulator NarL
MIRVLIVDGQADVRRGLRMRLAVEPDMAVVGDTGNAEQVLALAQALDPDAIVVDIGTRGAGVDMVKRLRSVAPAAAVVVLTLHGDYDTRAQAQEAGAQAFLEKDRGGADLLPQAIRQIAARQLDEGGWGGQD